MSSDLVPPKSKGHEEEDPGAHELDSTDGSDSFVDASEIQRTGRSGNASPIPITRVEKVDEAPRYGEVPGTSAYKLRTADAVPDEIEVVPEGSRSRSASRVSQPPSPGPKVPTLVVEKLDPDTPSYGDVPGTAAYELRKADAEPDEIIRSPQSASAPADPFKGMCRSKSPLPHSERLTGEASPTGESHRFDDTLAEEQINPREQSAVPGVEEEEEVGDDFDDFNDGREPDADDDFGDFDADFDEGVDVSQSFEPEPPPGTLPQPTIPVPDFSNLDDLSSIQSACAPYLKALFPSYPPSSSSSLPPPSQQIFLSERSVSLYTQLIAPPPLAPPNWLRSRIRRLFLVSLGVPVDLDEILPASKQKKLILPSVSMKSPDLSTSPRASAEDRPANDRLGKLRDGNDSSASLSSSASAKRRRKAGGGREGESVPEFDAAAAQRLAQTTRERIEGMDEAELGEHVGELGSAIETGTLVVAYWERRLEEATREKEAFEGVIENLIGFARKVRK